MKRIVTSDWQLAYNERDRYRTDFVVKSLPKLIEKYKPEQLLVLGDISELKDNHPAPLVNEIVSAFYNLQKQCKVIILEGNHDFLHKEHPYFKFVSMFPNIVWISTPMVLDNCLYLPHTRDHKKDWKDSDFKEHDFIFAHNIFTGVRAANGHALSGINPNIFPDNACVISGDVHEPQTIAGGKIIYVGSPCLCDFGDSYQPRVLLLDDLNIKSIKVHGQQKRLINLEWQGNGIAREDQNGANEGDIVKIQVELTMEDVAEWASIRQEVEAWATKNKFVVNTIVPQVSYVQGERQKLVKSVRKSDHQYLDAFVSRTGIDEHTARTGKELLED